MMMITIMSPFGQLDDDDDDDDGDDDEDDDEPDWPT
jgi:hypothetical protein